MVAARSVIPVRANVALVGVIAALNLTQLLLIPAALLPLDAGWGWLLALPALASTPHWSLIHEGVHANLHSSRAWNDRLSRVLCVLFGSPFQLLRLGHLMHHRFNRSPLNRNEVVETAPAPTLAERGRYYFKLFGGLWLGEFAASVLSILPDRFYKPIIQLGFGGEAPDGRTMMQAARRQLLEEPGRSRMRLDGLLITLAFGLSFWLYGAHWWMLALALLARAFLISFFDNAYHYANPLDDVMAAHNLRLPGWLQAGFLNFNHHATHHHRPTAPWTALPELREELGQRFEADFGRAALRQLNGPIPEFKLPNAREAPA